LQRARFGEPFAFLGHRKEPAPPISHPGDALTAEIPGLLRRRHNLNLNTQSVFDPSEDAATKARQDAVFQVLKPGDDIAIRDTGGQRLRFRITRVESLGRGKTPLLYTEAAGTHGGKAWHAGTGISRDYPSGSARLVEATPAVREFARIMPDGTTQFIDSTHPHWLEPEG
jgi:hypothetical protein